MIVSKITVILMTWTGFETILVYNYSDLQMSKIKFNYDQTKVLGNCNERTLVKISSKILLCILGKWGEGLWLWLWLLALVTCDSWKVTCETWHMIQEIWHITPATWHLKCDTWHLILVLLSALIKWFSVFHLWDLRSYFFVEKILY